MKKLILPFAILALSGTALAHPHDDDAAKEKPKAEKSWPYFGKKVVKKIERDESDSLSASDFAERMEKRMEKHSEKLERSLDKAKQRHAFKFKGDIDSADDIREVARALEDAMADSGILSSLADMMVDLAEDFDIENTEDGLTLKFDGDKIGRVKMGRNHHNEDRFDLEGFGRNLTIDKEVITENGKTKTRIVIEMDGDEEVEIDLKPKEKD
jgi:hypothetical protein